MELRETYPVKMLAEGAVIGGGEFRGMTACEIYLKEEPGLEPTPVKEILKHVRRLHVLVHGIGARDVLEYDLDGLLVPLHRAHHYVQVITHGTRDLIGSVSPDFLSLVTTPDDFEDVAYSVRQGAREIMWHVGEEFDSRTQERMLAHFREYLERSIASVGEEEIPWFYLHADTTIGRTHAQILLASLPVWAQPFWRLNYVNGVTQFFNE